MIHFLLKISSLPTLGRTYEVLASVILLSDAIWLLRLELIFDMFKGTGTDDLSHEDIRMAVQCICIGLSRVWNQLRWSTEELYKLSEGLANNAFSKLGMEIEETLDKKKFLFWAFERFKV